LCSVLNDQGHITESVRILLPVDRMKEKCVQITTKQVSRSVLAAENCESF